MKYPIFVLALASLLLTGCNEAPSGKACLGSNGDTLVESMPGQCKAGDIIGTKNPAYFCDFRHAVAFNGYNSAFCVFSGRQAEERTAN